MMRQRCTVFVSYWTSLLKSCPIFATSIVHLTSASHPSCSTRRQTTATVEQRVEAALCLILRWHRVGAPQLRNHVTKHMAGRHGEVEFRSQQGYTAMPGADRRAYVDIVEDNEEEDEIVANVHTLENFTWRDMRVGQQAAGDIFGRTRFRAWPSMPTFSTGGFLGGGGGGIGGGGDQDDANVAWWRAIGSIAKTRQAWLVAGGVLMAILLAVLLAGGGVKQEGVQSPLSAGAPRRRRDPSEPLSAMRKRLRDVADSGLATGMTQPMPTTYAVIRGGPKREYAKESGAEGNIQDGTGTEAGGMDFIVSVISRSALEAKAARATSPDSPEDFDPFDPRELDSRMVVDELPPTHSLVLNKFNTMIDHALIITREFRPQGEALNEYDFAAWYRVVQELPAVGFYNSGRDAGASQEHKHMQVIPEDTLWDYRPDAPEAVPLDEPISRLVRSSRDLDMIWEIPEFNFRHALCLVPEFDELVALQKAEVGEGNADEQRAVIAAYLRGRYLDLLTAVGFDTASLSQDGSSSNHSTVTPVALPPYNVVLTTRWLLVVPRSTREWNGVDVNGMGFFGALLVRAKEIDSEDGEEGELGIEAVRGPGPFTVLEAVTQSRR